MSSFADILDAASGLSFDEQQTLLEILQRRIAEYNRQQLKQDVDQARAEYAAGNARAASVEDIINEAKS